MKLVLIRHGQSEATVRGVVGGDRGCTGLSPKGRVQAEALRARLERSGEIRADQLLSSVLPRAVETAEIIASSVGADDFVRDCDLCELHPGECDGVEWSEYDRRYGRFDLQAEPDRPFSPGGESLNGFHARVVRAIHSLSERYADQTVVVVCHGGVIVSSIIALFDIPRPGTGAYLDPLNTSLTSWHHDSTSGVWRLNGFNDAAHLALLDREEAPA